MLVSTVIMDRQHVIPLIAIVAAVKEVFSPFHGDVAHLLNTHICGKRQQHVAGKPEFGRALPGLCPVLDNL